MCDRHDLKSVTDLPVPHGETYSAGRQDTIFNIKNLCLSLILLIAGCAPAQQLTYYYAPGEIPHTSRSMKTAGYWISRHPSPDQVILDQKGIERLNRRIRDEQKLTRDLSALTAPVSGVELRQTLLTDWQGTKDAGYYDDRKLKAGDAFFQTIQSDMNLDTIPESIPPRYGVILHYADQRILPMEQGLYAKAGDMDFDELENSALDLGTPVVVVHQSSDTQWLYVYAASSDGWVKADQVALCSFEDMNRFLSPENFAVAIRPKVDIYADAALTKHIDYVQMGARLPMTDGGTEHVIAVDTPSRNEDGTLRVQTGYVKKSDISVGYLIYTPRTILEQAFALLNTPYGWGGMYGEQDCSRFLQEVYATVGIRLSRNSKAQAQVGEVEAAPAEATVTEKKNWLNEHALAGTTLIYMKGHILLFIGTVEGRPYAIHSVWAYRQKGKRGDDVFVLNRTVVSDLSLGEGSLKGSLLERMISVNHLK